MGDHFNWHFDEESAKHAPQATLSGRPWWFWLVTLVLVAALLAGWAYFQEQTARATQGLLEAAQAVLDLHQQAVRNGDGELFLSLQDGDTAWLAAQLRAENLALYRSGPRLTNAEQHGPFVWASATGQLEGETLQRVIFFQWRGDQLRQVAGDPAYWGSRRAEDHAWGELSFTEADEPWRGSIAAFVDTSVASTCRLGCLDGRVPFRLVVREDFQETAEPGVIAVPSPRLVGLDESGRPAARFWQELGERLQAHLTPATIRFAIPPAAQQRFDYEQAAVAFSAAHPEITVELVTLEALPEDPGYLAQYDGAAAAPSLEMVTAGLVRDLTDYMHSDPEFDEADFYEQIWQGALWQERMWFMPQAAGMRLIFYHRDAYESLPAPEPSLHWTWAEMIADATALQEATFQTGEPVVWPYLDPGLDTLYSYAYSEQSQCRQLEVTPCPLPLQAPDAAAALAWYHNLVVERGLLPDAGNMPAEERDRLLINSLFDVAIWVDEPVYFEHRSLMFPMGVRPLPGSDRFSSAAPLHVSGSFISQRSERPRAVWDWLRFLSHWEPMARYRLVPARPSVAGRLGYWSNLPPPLAEAMRASFSLTRPVRLEEQGLFTWEQVAAVMDGRFSPQEAAARQLPAWFGAK